MNILMFSNGDPITARPKSKLPITRCLQALNSHPHLSEVSIVMEVFKARTISSEEINGTMKRGETQPGEQMMQLAGPKDSLYFGRDRSAGDKGPFPLTLTSLYTHFITIIAIKDHEFLLPKQH